MSVHYKFKSALEYDTVTFDGLHISVKDLKKAILHQKKIGKTSDFDLQITNAQTKETYTDENVLIPKNTSLIVARVPLTQQQRKQWEKEKLLAAGKLGEGNDQNALGQVDISSLDLSEEDKIKTMMSQSTSDYDPSNYVKVRGGNQVGAVPPSYTCFKCHQRGHWIKDCPADGSALGITESIKKSTGIPRSFMIEVDGPQVPGARMTPSGHYAVPVIDHEVYKEKKIEKPPFLAEKEKPAQTPSIPEDLVCGICQDLLQDAVMVPCCGISFCNDCIQNALIDSEDNQCPDCSEKDVSPDTLIPNRFLRTSVNTFKNKTGYVKTKTHIIQQRPPSPPRPSLPDFVPPPEYVDPSSTSTDTQKQSSKATPSPIYQSSPASALQITHSPFQNQTTPVYSESSPFGDNSNSFPIPDKSPAYQDRPHPYGGQPPYGVDPYRQGPYPSQRHPGPGHFQNFRHSPANFSGQFTELPPGVSPVPGTSAPRRMGSENFYKNKDRPKERLEAVRKEVEIRDDLERTPSDSQDGSGASRRGQENGVKTSPSLDAEKSESKLSEPETRRKSKKSGLDVDDVSSVSSTASDEPPPPAESRRPAEGHHDPSQGPLPSYAIPSLFSGQHPVTLPPPGTVPYPPPPHPRPGDVFPHSSSAEERSSTPTVDERLEVPPIRPPYDPYRPPNFMVPGYDPHYGMPPVHPMPPYDPNMMYDRGFRGHPRGPRMPRQRYALRQPPPPGSRPLTPPGNEEEAFLAFQRMLKEKEERDKRKNEKLKASRRSNSRSRSRSAARSRRSYSGGRSRSRSRSRTPNRRSRSRSKKRTRSRSRSFVISRSRSRSYSRSPLHERNYSPKKYYSPHRSPQRYERYEGSYGNWNQDHREYRRGGYRGRGRGRFYNKNSPPRGHDHQSFNRYRNENYSTSPTRHYKSPNRYYDQHRVSPRHNDYSRDSRDRDYRSYDRESEPAVRDRSSRRRSHSNSVARNNFDSDRTRERDRDRDREGSYRRRSSSRQSISRKYSPARKPSPVRSERDRSKEKSPVIKHKDYDKEKEGRNRSRERRSYDNAKEKRKHSRERERSKEYDRRHKSRERSEFKEKSRHDKERSRSREIKKSKRSLSREKRKRSTSRRRSSSRHRKSISRSKDDRRRTVTPDSRKKGSESPEREKDRSISRDKEEVVKRSPSREKLRNESPKIPEEDEKKEKKKDKDKKKKKKEKEKETDEERAARKKRKKEKKEEKKRKQEIKAAELKNKENKDVGELVEESKIKAEKNSPEVAPHTELAPNFVSTFKEVPADDLKSSPNTGESPRLKFDSSGDQATLLDSTEEGVEENLEPGEIIDQDEAIEIKDDASESGRRFMSVISGDNSEEMDTERGLGDDNVELEIHASYESLLEESGENQKKGILAPVPEKSKWELDESQVSAGDANQKQKGLTSAISPEFPAKVTREVIKRAENAIFKRAVNAIREPTKKSSEKEERKERKVIVAPERDRSKDRTEVESEKVRRVIVPKEKEKVHRSTVEVVKPKTEVKRTMNSLQITVPLRSENESAETEKVVKVKRKDDHSSRSSPPAGRISIKDRLGSKVEKLSRNPSPVSRSEKRRRSTDDEYSDSKSSRKEQPNRPTLSSAIESIDPKRSTIDESHFVPNYDESSDEEENPKSRHLSEKESKSKESESKKRARSSSESSEESTRKHKKKKSKSKKSKKKKRKHVSDSSDSSDSEREKKKHKKSKKKKKSKH